MIAPLGFLYGLFFILLTSTLGCTTFSSLQDARTTEKDKFDNTLSMGTYQLKAEDTSSSKMFKYPK